MQTCISSRSGIGTWRAIEATSPGSEPSDQLLAAAPNATKISAGIIEARIPICICDLGCLLWFCQSRYKRNLLGPWIKPMNYIPLYLRRGAGDYSFPGHEIAGQQFDHKWEDEKHRWGLVCKFSSISWWMIRMCVISGLWSWKQVTKSRLCRYFAQCSEYYW